MQLLPYSELHRGLRACMQKKSVCQWRILHHPLWTSSGKFKGTSCQESYISWTTCSNLLGAMNLRNAEVDQLLAPLREEIHNYQCKVSYHKSSQANYISQTIMQYAASDPLPSCIISIISRTDEQGRLSWQDTSSFNIREDFFICGSADKSEKN